MTKSKKNSLVGEKELCRSPRANPGGFEDREKRSRFPKQAQPEEMLLAEQEFCALLSKMIKTPSRIILTRNRSSLISVRTDKNGLKIVRVQHAFRAADTKVIAALAEFAEGGESPALKAINEFISKKQDIVKFFSKRPSNNPVPGPIGEYKNLVEILKKVMDDHGIFLRNLNITWSRARKIHGKQYSIRFGSYINQSGTIRIHPSLDSPEIPDYFIEYIIYHEILHAILPPTTQPGGKKRRIHTREFKSREKGFRDYDRAKRFEKRLVKKWLG